MKSQAVRNLSWSLLCGTLAAAAGCDGLQRSPLDPVQASEDAGSDQPGAQSTSDKFALWSTGLNLRGANIYQRRVYPEIDGTTFIGPGPIGPPQEQSDFDHLAAMGANYVNLSVPGAFTERPPYQLDTAALANLDDLVAKATAARLFVVISLRTGPGRSEFAIHEGQTWFPQSLVNNQVWTSQDAQDAWVEMWRTLADHFKGNPVIVGFDLMMEPNGASTIYGEWNPALFDLLYAGTLPDWNQLHPRLAAAIREVDADTPVLVSPNAYGSIDWLSRLKPSGVARTVYSVHNYDPMEFTHQDPGAGVHYPGEMTVDDKTQTVNADYLAGRLDLIDKFRTARGAPVAVTEFGVKRWAPGAAAYVADITSQFEQRGLNHAQWLWESSYAGLAEVDDFNFRHGPDPENHVDVPGSDLMDAILGDWARNTLRP